MVGVGVHAILGDAKHYGVPGVDHRKDFIELRCNNLDSLDVDAGKQHVTTEGVLASPADRLLVMSQEQASSRGPAHRHVVDPDVDLIDPQPERLDRLGHSSAHLTGDL